MDAEARRALQTSAANETAGPCRQAGNVDAQAFIETHNGAEADDIEMVNGCSLRKASGNPGLLE